MSPNEFLITEPNIIKTGTFTYIHEAKNASFSLLALSECSGCVILHVFT